MYRQASILLLFPILMLVVGCASNIPREIQHPPAENPTVEQVRNDIDYYTGSRVRWGGTIASVENREQETWVEVVARELGRNGRPGDDDDSYGRFLVRIGGFVDPQIYSRGRELTVAGEVESRIVRKIGEHPYTYPLIRASTHHLWPQYASRRDSRSRASFGGYYGVGYPYYGTRMGFGYRRWYPYPYYW